MKENDIHAAIQVLRRANPRSKKPPSACSPSNGQDPFRVLISAMLSLHIKDSLIAAAASERLLALADSPQAMARLTPQQIQDVIANVNFFRAKAHHILQVCRILVDRYDSRVPDNRDDLMSLPGIGPKTASLVVIQAYDKPAICVDMHVHRIANRWGYIATNSPAKTEAALRAKLPRDYWLEISEELGALGEEFCRPAVPKCLACPVKTYCDRVGVAKSH